MSQNSTFPSLNIMAAGKEEDLNFWDEIFHPEKGMGSKNGKAITCRGCPPGSVDINGQTRFGWHVAGVPGHETRICPGTGWQGGQEKFVAWRQRALKKMSASKAKAEAAKQASDDHQKKLINDQRLSGQASGSGGSKVLGEGATASAASAPRGSIKRFLTDPAKFDLFGETGIH